MKRKTASFTGTRPIFTGSPSIVPGGFNLDKENQSFAVGDIIPGGSLAIRNEETRKVQILKSAKVSTVDPDEATIVYLHVDEFYAPCFVPGEYVAAISAAGLSAPAQIIKIEESESSYKLTLSSPIDPPISNGDILVEVAIDDEGNHYERGIADCVTIKDVTVSEFETAVDVCADTMQYALYERRVTPIPPSQKDSSGYALKGNPLVRLTKSL